MKTGHEALKPRGRASDEVPELVDEDQQHEADAELPAPDERVSRRLRSQKIDANLANAKPKRFEISPRRTAMGVGASARASARPVPDGSGR